MAYDNIPIIVVLWQHSNYGGRRVLLTKDTPRLSPYDFNDRTSAIGIHPGPDFDPNAHYTVGFYRDSYYRGARILLTPGAYPSLSPWNFNDKISSVNFDPRPDVPAISPIPLVVELYEHSYYRGKKCMILEDVANIHDYADFGDMVSSVRVFQGPNYTTGKKAVLYRDVNYRGGKIELEVGNYSNIGTSHGFNDVLSSIKVR